MENEQNRQKSDLGLTGLSNSRLNGDSVPIQDMKVSFDRITIVGDLIPEQAKILRDLVAFDSNISVRDAKTDMFECHALSNKAYIRYDKYIGQALERRNMRIEFNPNELTREEEQYLFDTFVSRMTNRDFSRIDLAFDINMDLKQYYVMSDKAIKETIFLSRKKEVETKYFGVRDSERYIRIYDKKKQLSEVKEKEIEDEYLWRIEFELKRNMTKKWDVCFDDLNILQPAWKTLEKSSERAMVYMLLNEEDEWGYLDRKTKAKFKKIIKEISDVHLENDMKNILQNEHTRLKNELADWMRPSQYDKMRFFKH